MTVRLYLEDPCCCSCDGHVVGSRQGKAGWEVALDRTCFYPAGGGQPADLGTVGGLPVLQVHEEAGQVWHVLPEAPAGTSLRVEVDWRHRFDHMQQHSGQHILSSVALDRLGAQTVSFHLGTELVTIDLALADLPPGDGQALEDEANRIVMDDLPVRSFYLGPDDPRRPNLRKPPTKGERTRIIEIVGVDLSPCGGTHVRRTGQVGAIKIRRQERYKGGTRLEFVCGWRAMRDYQWKHQALTALARDLSTSDREVEAAVRRTSANEKEARRQIEQLQCRLVGYEAAALRGSAAHAGTVAIVTSAFADRAVPEVKHLANVLAGEPQTVALLAALTPTARLFFVRSHDLDLDMRALLQQVSQRYGGGGGGRPEAAEGGGMPADKAPEALAWAIQQLEAKLAY